MWTWPKGTGGNTESKVAPADFQKISLNMNWEGSTCPQLNISALFAGRWALLGSQLSLSEKGPAVKQCGDPSSYFTQRLFC